MAPFRAVPAEAQSIEDRLRREMLEIFYSRNVE